MQRRDAAGTSGYVLAGDLRLHHLEYGQGDPAVVVLPGITSPAITWEFVAERLATGGRVIVLDIRGRGLSDTPDTGYALTDYASDAAAVITALGLEQPVVLGHSMGARIAVALADTAPHLVGPLIVVDPPLTGPGRAPYPTSLDSFRRQLREAYAGTTAEEVLRFYPRWDRRQAQLRSEWLASCAEHAVVQTWEHFHDEEFFALWASVPSPVLFMYGEESPVTTPGLDEVRQTNPRAELVGIPGAGHMIPWENLDAFLAAVRDFIAAQVKAVRAAGRGAGQGFIKGG